MYKNLKVLTVECLEITTCTGNFFLQNNLFQMDPSAENCKNQETNRIKSKKINRTLKLCTLATSNLTLS